MSDDSYALSPITPASRAGTMAIASESDYEAICATVMGTARGRQFLAEYARRNRNTDTAAVLDAIARIEAAMRGEPVAPSDDRMRLALAEFAQAIAHTKAEMVAVEPDGEDQGNSDAASQAFADQADADEDPKADLMAAAEGIQDVAWTLREHDGDTVLCDQLEKTAQAVTAVAARDALTRGRSEKAAQLLRRLESRIHALIEANGATSVGANDRAGNGHDANDHDTLAAASAPEPDPSSNTAEFDTEPAPSGGILVPEPTVGNTELPATEPAPPSPPISENLSRSPSGLTVQASHVLATVDLLPAPIPVPSAPPEASEPASELASEPMTSTVMLLDFLVDFVPPAPAHEVAQSAPASIKESDATQSLSSLEQVVVEAALNALGVNGNTELPRAAPDPVRAQPETEVAAPERMSDAEAPSRAEIALAQGFAAVRAAAAAADNKPPAEPAGKRAVASEAASKLSAPAAVTTVEDSAAGLYAEKPKAPTKRQAAPAATQSQVKAQVKAAPSDPLAPIMVLSDEEKIALFC